MICCYITKAYVIVNGVEESHVSFCFTETCKEKLLSCSLCNTLVDYLQTPEGDENFESILDILIALAEWGTFGLSLSIYSSSIFYHITNLVFNVI